MIGQVLQTLISAVTVIAVAYIIGRDANGEVFVVMIPVNVALLLQDMGISTALTRFCALFRHEERLGDLNVIVRTGLAFSALLAVLMSLTLYLLAGPISVVWLQRPDLEWLFRIASLTVAGQALMSTAQAIFVGYELMHFRAGMQVAWSILRGLVVFPLVFLGYRAFGPVIASTASSILLGLAGVLLALYFYKFEKGSDGLAGSEALRLILGFGLPFYLGSLISGGLGQVYSTLMTTYATTGDLGDYSAAMNFAVLVSFFTLPIGTTLFPMFSKMKGDDARLRPLYMSAVKYTSLVVTPIAACLIVVARPLTHVIYPNYINAGLYLGLYLVAYLFEGLGGQTLSNLLVGMGESRVILWSSVVSFVVGVPIALLLVPYLGVTGAIMAMIVAPRAGWLYQYLWLRGRKGPGVGWRDTALIYLSVALSFLVAYGEYTLLELHGWVALIVCTASFFVVYLVALPLSGVLGPGDFQQLRAITAVTGPLGPLLRILLSVMQRFARVKS